jgi:cytochrome c peroxidase
VNVGGQAYFKFGVVQQPGSEILPRADRGRSAVTHAQSDDYVFRAPALRNVELTAPYFHSGTVWDLRQAVDVMGTAQLGQDLLEAEKAAIVAFLRTLTGEQPVVEYPTLPTHTADTPLPDVGVGGNAQH